MSIFAYFSDVHLGFFPSSADYPVLALHEQADTILLAGDIMDGVKTSAVDWVLRQCEGRRGYMTLGNHELYGSRRDKAVRTLRSAFRGTHVSLLMNDLVDLGDVWLAGTDLWTDFGLFGNTDICGRFAEEKMSDYRRITIKARGAHGDRYRKLRASDTKRWHEQALRFVNSLPTKLDNRPWVLMTHHAPSPRSLSVSLRQDMLGAAYASCLTGLFRSLPHPPSAIVHGHIHEAVDYQWVKGIRVLCNPHGYYGRNEETGFSPTKAFHLSPEGGVTPFR